MTGRGDALLCDTGKVAHPSHASARRAAVDVMRTRRGRRVRLRVYQCDGCRWWHLTSQPARGAWSW